jgi:exopolysaccharide biosynthesis polyprenyl glycosylphosphotransferase
MLTVLWRNIVPENKHHFSINSLKLLDLCFAILSLGLTTAIIVHEQHQISLGLFFSARIKVANFIIFLLTLVVYHCLFQMFGLYQSRRLSSRGAEIADVLKAVTLFFAALVVIGSLFSIRMFTLPFLVSFWAINALIVSTFRLALRIFLEHIRANGRNQRNVLICGTNARALSFARKITGSPELGYRLLGFVDDDWPGMVEFRESGFDVVSDYAGLAEFLRRSVVDELVIYLPFASFYRYLTETASLCAHHGIVMRLNSDIFGLKKARWLAEEYGNGHYIASYTGAGEGWPLAIKRTLDLAISSLLLLLLLPLLVAAAIAIKLTSKGPVLFLQERIGMNKRRFKIYKFRTMIPNAEQVIHTLEGQNEATGPVFKIKNDPRITPIGKFLRRSSIDELPQLLNVLKGDMSLVGPRPLPVRDYEGFSEDWQRRRFSVKPGITCLWQVNGRSGISFDQWMLLDLQYLDEWSLWLDLKILAKTVPAVLKGAGAA